MINSFWEKKIFSISRSYRCLWATARTLQHGRLCFSKKTWTLKITSQKTQLHYASHSFSLKHRPLPSDVRARISILCMCVCRCVSLCLCVFRGFLSHSSVQVFSASPLAPFLHSCLPPYPFPFPLPLPARARRTPVEDPFNARVLVAGSPHHTLNRCPHAARYSGGEGGVLRCFFNTIHVCIYR